METRLRRVETGHPSFELWSLTFLGADRHCVLRRWVESDKRAGRHIRPVHALTAIVACVVLGAPAVAARAATRSSPHPYQCLAGLIQTGTDDSSANGSNCAYQLAASFPLGGAGDPSLNATMVPSLDVLPVWRTTQGAGVTVGLLDTGVDPAHPDLLPNLLLGTNTYNGSGDTSDQSGHGTILASIIAAAAGNGGYVGIAPRAHVLPVKVMGGPNGVWSARAAVKGIYYAIGHGASVINCSFGALNEPMPGMRAALRAAAKANVVVVLAAGNSGVALGQGNTFYPDGAGLVNTVTVANFDDEGKLASDSNYGTGQVQVAAPGDYLYGDIPANPNGGVVGGTSAATAAVSGVVALLRSAYPRASAPQIVRALIRGATPVASLRRKVSSGGVVSASRALASLAGQ